MKIINIIHKYIHKYFLWNTKIESSDELTETDIKNRTCYYFDDIIIPRDINFDNIFLDIKLCKKEYENTLICEIWYKSSAIQEPLRIRFDKIDGFIRASSGKFRYFW